MFSYLSFHVFLEPRSCLLIPAYLPGLYKNGGNGPKLGQVEPQRAKLPSDNAKMERTIARLERERDQARGMVDEMKGKLDGAEDLLNQTLMEFESSKNEAKATYQ